MKVILDGRLMDDKEKHLLNAKAPMEVILPGRTIDDKEEHIGSSGGIRVNLLA